MHCGAFRDRHAAYIDDALDDATLDAVRGHLADCRACAEHDTAVRRALVLFRNLPTIQPSPDFSARLQARLRESGYDSGVHAGADAARPASVGLLGFASAAAGVVAAGYLAVAVFGTPASVRAELALSPVVARATPPLSLSPFTVQPMVMASFEGLLPAWPSDVFASRTPIRLSAVSLTDASPDR
jgi:anti-sigma factor RsiW